MAQVHFTLNLRSLIDCPTSSASGASVKEILTQVFAANPRLRDFIVDEHFALRKHVVVFVDGVAVTDRDKLTDAAAPDSEIYVMQALSGG